MQKIKTLQGLKQLHRSASLSNNIYLATWPTSWSVDHAAHATTRPIPDDSWFNECYDLLCVSNTSPTRTHCWSNVECWGQSVYWMTAYSMMDQRFSIESPLRQRFLEMETILRCQNEGVPARDLVTSEWVTPQGCPWSCQAVHCFGVLYWIWLVNCTVYLRRASKDQVYPLATITREPSHTQYLIKFLAGKNQHTKFFSETNK